ncbi:MAG: hypothetical protein IJA87_08040 [Clostridia bacterium]|nr:hypothetical protein [Clostridia bacterium]
MTENPVLFIVFSMLAMCFGWGIRGSAIGGEKGAMLPGAFMGIMCVWYTGSELLMDNVFLFAAACALGYFYGGMEPYASTMFLILHHDKPRYSPPLGYLALSFKGSIWGGLGSAFLGMSFSAMGGVYRWYDFVIFFALVPILQEIGYRIFNTPYDPEHGRMPKVGFSEDSREEWGRNVVIVASLLIMAAIRGDIFTIIMWVGGALFGAIGWVIGITLYDKQLYPLKNGKRLFGKLDELGVIDGWKMMELFQGLAQGFGISSAFIIAWPLAKEKLSFAEETGALWHPIPQTVDTVLSWVFCVLIILTIFLFIIPYRKNGNKITKAFGEVDMNIVEVLERPCYMVGPLALVMLGSTTMASIICCFTMYYVIAQHDGLERYWDYKGIRLIRVFLILVGAVILAVQILRGYTLWETWIFYCVGYLIFEFFFMFRPKLVKENYKKSKTAGQFIASFGCSSTVYPSYLVMMTALLIFGGIYFR